MVQAAPVTKSRQDAIVITWVACLERAIWLPGQGPDVAYRVTVGLVRRCRQLGLLPRRRYDL